MTKSEYAEYLRSDHWMAKRKEALDHYGRQCTICDSKANLNIHHFTYANIGRERLSELTVVCNGCHKLLHGLK